MGGVVDQGFGGMAGMIEGKEDNRGNERELDRDEKKRSEGSMVWSGGFFGIGDPE